MKRLESKYAPLHLVPLIERLGTPQVVFTFFTELPFYVLAYHYVEDRAFWHPMLVELVI